MKSRLHIPPLEENPNDAQLVERMLAAGSPCSSTRATARAGYMAALEDKKNYKFFSCQQTVAGIRMRGG
jgi:hypothetical protein